MFKSFSFNNNVITYCYFFQLFLVGLSCLLRLFRSKRYVVLILAKQKRDTCSCTTSTTSFPQIILFEDSCNNSQQPDPLSFIFFSFSFFFFFWHKSQSGLFPESYQQQRRQHAFTCEKSNGWPKFSLFDRPPAAAAAATNQFYDGRKISVSFCWSFPSSYVYVLREAAWEASCCRCCNTNSSSSSSFRVRLKKQRKSGVKEEWKEGHQVLNFPNQPSLFSLLLLLLLPDISLSSLYHFFFFPLSFFLFFFFLFSSLLFAFPES